MVMLMLVEVSPSPMATEPVVGRKSAPGTANWSAGSPEAIAVLKRERRGRGREEKGKEREGKEREGERRRGKERTKGNCLICLASAAC